MSEVIVVENDVCCNCNQITCDMWVCEECDEYVCGGCAVLGDWMEDGIDRSGVFCSMCALNLSDWDVLIVYPLY